MRDSYLGPPELADAFAEAITRALEAPAGKVPSIDREWLELGRRAARTRRIYLDKNVWIWIRDVELGRARDPRHEDLLEALEGLVERGSHFCPASDVLFCELLDQRDRTTRLATARVIDRLSTGISLAPQPLRAQLEFFHWLMRSMAPERELGDPLEAAWLPLFHVLGPLVPHQDGLPERMNEALQYAWLHASSGMKLADMLEVLGEPPPILEDKDAFAERMTEGKETHAATAGGFEDLLAAELQGGVESYAEALDAAVRQVGTVLTGSDPGSMSEKNVRIFGRLVAEGHKGGKLGKDLPTLQVGAAFHARVRADPKRKYKRGDWMDGIHAAASVPYCDVLFTESSLRHLLTTKPTDVSTEFGCEVISDLDQMLQLLRSE